MDETPSEASSSIKEEKSIENSNVPETFSWEKNVVISVPKDLSLERNGKYCGTCLNSSPFIFHDCTKTWVKTNDASHVMKRDCGECVASEEYLDKPIGRIREPFYSQRDIAFVRECKRIELLWKNRGLPVDKESLCSAASKDPFDLKDLSESLPSTSTEKLHRGLSSNAGVLIDFHKNHIRPNARKMRLLSMLEPKPQIRNVDRMDSFERHDSVPDICKSLRECVMKDRLLRAQRWSRWKRMHSKLPHLELDKERDCEEQKEACKERGDSDVEEMLPSWVHQGPEPRDPNVCPEFAGMSLDDKQEEKRTESQSSDAEKSQGSVLLATSPDLHEMAGQCSGWDSKRSWVTDFADHRLPGLRVSFDGRLETDIIVSKNVRVRETFNDALSKEEFDKDMKERREKLSKILPLKLKEKWDNLKAEIEQHQMWMLREQSKLRILNRHRGVPEDIEFSESETNLEQTLKSSAPNRPNLEKMAKELCLTNLKVCRKLMMHLGESIKSFRSGNSRLSLGSVKSDKVLPD